MSSSHFGEAMKPVVEIVAALTVLCGFAVGTKSVAAHHAMVMYDRSTTVTLDGTVVEFQWTNPHVFLLVSGKIDAAEEPAVWRLETSGPSNLMRQGGWSATALKPGDRVRVQINPLREPGLPNARLIKVRLLDTGQELGASYLDLDLRRPQ
jgi:Family of unknown function (DUF6152)